MAVTIVTGPPGAGKTTVAAALADSLDRSAHLEADWFWRAVRRGYVYPWLSESHGQNVALMGIAGTTAAGYAAAGYDVVADGIVGPWLLDRFREPLAGVVLRYVVLRPELDVALARATARDAGELTHPDPIRQMHREFADLGAYERFAVDTSDLDPDETLALLQHRLAAGTHDL